jgi:signal transduction histidine kinase
MRNWWRRSLAAQFIGFMLFALVISQILSFSITRNEQENALFLAAKSEFLSRTVSITRLIESVPRDLRQEALSASETSYSRFWITQGVPADANVWRDAAARELARPLANTVDTPHFATVVPPVSIERDAERFRSANANQPWASPSSQVWTLAQPARFTYLDGTNGFGLVVELGEGNWLNSAYYRAEANPWWNSRSLFSLAIAAAILSLIGIVAARQIARPLRRLATSAEAIGRGENVEVLPEVGPDDIRLTTAAFNRMQARLFRFVEDRTRMLAAIGHDLRTPLTSLRLRAEFVTDADAQQRMLATIDEIQTMTEAMIALARGEATVEETRTVDLNALLGSLCDDMADLGQPVEYVDGKKTVYRCRPDGLRRAIRNVIENAVRYGGLAHVSIDGTPSTIDIVVQDSGPGIPDIMKGKVFEPFFRLESSRSRETGGVGLGLSIARAIIRHHGGDILLSANDPGLKVVLSLPRVVAGLNVQTDDLPSAVE